jgi:uncharacterized LabA/DUF88 family protein
MENINLASHSNQRVAVFIDTQNLYHSDKSNYRSNVDYEELMVRAVNGRNLIRAFAYVIKSEENTEAKFFEAIEELGIETRVKDLQIFHTGAKKADWDVGIAVDMIRLTEKVDVVVLASGDGDFLEVVRYCQSRGVRVEQMAFEKTANSKIMAEVDYFLDLGDKDSNFLISGRRKRSSGKNVRSFIEQKKPLSNTAQPVDFDSYAHPNYHPDNRQVNNQSQTSQRYISANPTQLSEHKVNYGGNNLPSYLRSANQNVEVNENIYGIRAKERKIKPVIGLPAKKPLAKRRPSNPSGSINNAFGNTRNPN